MTVSIIVAYNKNRIIGVDNDLPWRLKEDMKHFKETTTGHVCIMGRKTWESIPPKFRPLPGRANVILTRKPEEYLEVNPEIDEMREVHISGDLMNAIELSKFVYPERDIFITGGGEIYRQACEEKVVDEIIASEVKGYEDITEGTVFSVPSGSWHGELLKEFDDFDIWLYEKRHDESLVLRDDTFEMDDDDFHTREKATREFSELCMKSKPVFELASKLQNGEGISLEVKYRVRGALGIFYRPANKVNVPIWSLPKEYRYIDGKDKAKEYYEKARDLGHFAGDWENKFYNHDELMVMATRMYFADWLGSFKGRKKMDDLHQKIKKSWEEEYNLTLKYGTSTGGCCSLELRAVPPPVEDRFKFLKNKLETKEDEWTYQVDEKNIVFPASEYFDCGG
ncbi:unnamed protein product [Symbiodinium microadriaticum]|nr:unnamed protein product [Symbiodinium microadriaticum]